MKRLATLALLFVLALTPRLAAANEEEAGPPSPILPFTVGAAATLLILVILCMPSRKG